MRAGRWSGWWLVVLGGCCTPGGGALLPESGALPVPRIREELPLVLTTPAPPLLQSGRLPSAPVQPADASVSPRYRLLSDEDCRQRAVVAAARRWQAVDPPGPSPVTPRFRFYAALEARNQAAAQALLLYYQLAALHARRPLLRQSLDLTETLLVRAEAARAEKVPYPLDPQELALQRSQLRDALEQMETAVRLLNIELKRLLDWPAQPEQEQFWPTGEFEVVDEAMTPDQAAAWAERDRAELRAWRSLRDEPQTWASTAPTPRGETCRRWLWPGLARQRAVEEALEVQRRRRQVEAWLQQRTREITDEARAAAVVLSEQTRRLAAAHQRLQLWDQRLAEAQRKSQARQPNADVYEAQIRWQRSLAEAELVGEIAAWHQARVRLRAALGWFAYDDLSIPLPHP